MGEKVRAQSRATPTHTFEKILPPCFISTSCKTWHPEALGGHALRVAAYSYAIAKAYGLTEASARKLRQASLFHDIGKLLIPRQLLAKPAPLTAEEHLQIQDHTSAGCRLLLNSGKSAVLREAALIALYHHEYFDGSGYLHGLRGTAIPLVVRLVSVADVFDALTSQRVYRPALSQDRALKFIQRASGRQFDPMSVEALLLALESYPGLQAYLHSVTENYSDAAMRHTRDESALRPELVLGAWHEHAA